MSTERNMGMPEERRSLLTDREREILNGQGEEVSEKYYGVVVSRVRNKINQLDDDITALEQHETLAAELREVVCEEPATEEREASTDGGETGTETESDAEADTSDWKYGE